MFFFLLIFFVLTCSSLTLFLTSSLQKSSRHAAHHAEAAGDGREHGNDEIDDSFQGFLFHGFNFLNVSFFITLVFPSVSPFPFPIPSLWKRQNDQMTK